MKKACPRCFNYIPNNEAPGAYPGAISRADDKTEICSHCGMEEAFEMFFESLRPQKTNWPIIDWSDFEKEFHVKNNEELTRLAENIFENIIAKKKYPQSIKDAAAFHLAEIYKCKEAEEKAAYAVMALDSICPPNHTLNTLADDEGFRISYEKQKKEQKA